MSLGSAAGGESFDVAYLVLSGTTTAVRCPELLRELVGVGFSTVIAIPTPNASRVIAPRDLADIEGVQVVESYFDLAIRPRPPRGVVLFAPCSFNSLNKLAHGIADNLALSVVAEAIGRGTPVIVGPSLNAPLLDHPEARASLKKLPTWGVTIVPPVDQGEGPRLAPSAVLVDAVRPTSVKAEVGERRDRQPCRCIPVSLDHQDDHEDEEGLIMAGESGRFGLRDRPPTPAVRPFDLPSRLKPMLERANAGLAEPFRGIASGGEIISGLFALQRTGVSLAPVMEAARSFLATLTSEQRQAACFAIGDEAWRMWSNIHPWLMRHGVCLADLGSDQREAALALLQESMSASGYRTARDIMKLNEHALEITGKREEYGEWFYWVSIFGTPSPSEPWGWQIDGHHLIVNCFVLGDQLVLTPNFMGSEPVLAHFGKYAGTRVFAAEEEQGCALMRMLSLEERRRATISTDLPSEVLTAAFNDNRRIDPAGVRYDELSPEGRERLEGLLATYVGRIRTGHGEIRYAEAKRHLSETHFAWIGPFDDTSPFYYRIQSPVILVEFDHQSGIVYDNDRPSRDHIHTVVRTPNGNDYGKDLLRQHYAQHDHSHPRTAHREA